MIEESEQSYQYLLTTENVERMKLHQETKNILLIDDDEELCEGIEDYLNRHGYRVETAHTPSLAFEILVNKRPDLILLDVMLPEQDGFSICKEIVGRPERYGNLPIIMLTARGDVFDRVVGLELGADDYLPKPFEPRELLARIGSVLRRHRGLVKAKIGSKLVPPTGLHLDSRAQRVWLDGKALTLTSMEYALLSLFIARTGELISRDEIMEHLRGTDADIYSRAVDALVSRLRHKLQDRSRDPQFIKTIWGRGYCFLGVNVD